MLSLTGLTHSRVATFFSEESYNTTPTPSTLEKRVRLRESLSRFPPIIKTSITTEAMYAPCRWAGLMMLAVESLHILIHLAVQHVRIQPRLIKRLHTTNLAKI